MKKSLAVTLLLVGIFVMTGCASASTVESALEEKYNVVVTAGEWIGSEGDEFFTGYNFIDENGFDFRAKINDKVLQDDYFIVATQEFLSGEIVPILSKEFTETMGVNESVNYSYSLGLKNRPTNDDYSIYEYEPNVLKDKKSLLTAYGSLGEFFTIENRLTLKVVISSHEGFVLSELAGLSLVRNMYDSLHAAGVPKDAIQQLEISFYDNETGEQNHFILEETTVKHRKERSYYLDSINSNN